MGYRPALDGLRAIAVLLVIARHLQFPLILSGGAVGVGLFFALSGFLITTLLVEERTRSGTVSLRAFYLRRFLRLMPALFFMLVAVIILGWMLGVSGIVHQAVFAAFYAGNWAQITGGYFPVLGHTWSLAVEEHFYLLWPVVFLLAWRWKGRRAALSIAIGVASLALLLRVGLFFHGASAARLQYGSDTRADAILVGCAAALLTAGRSGRSFPLLPRWVAPVAWSGLAVLLFVQPQGRMMLTAGLSLIAVCGAVVVTDAVAGRSLFVGVLSWKPLVSVGRVSYGLYLWHYAVIALLLGRLEARMPSPVAKAVVVLIFAAATLFSYRFVEQPALALKRRLATKTGPDLAAELRGPEHPPTKAPATSLS
jgi:peptidoglycan/LPS O-acetylase OafA/YrhL